MEDKYYRTENETTKRLEELFDRLPPMFCAQVALYARNEAGMRSITHYVAYLIAKHVKGQVWTKSFFDKIIHRVDDMTEIMALYLDKEGGKIPNSVKKGFASALQRQSEYSLSKYKGEGKSVSLVDLVNLVHPKSNEALTKLMKGELKPAETWEVKLSNAGNEEDVEEAKSKAWKDLVLEKKIGYFALLRNLRNILEQCPDIVPQVCELLQDRGMIKKSLVLPFRFLKALEVVQELSNSRELIKAINNAIEISLDNVPKFDGKTLVALDVSGSMDGRPSEIGALFSAVLYKSNNADLLIFNTNAKYINLNPSDSVITLANGMRFNGGGTDFKCIFKTVDRKYDRIIILSDMQSWVDHNSPAKVFNEYKQKYGATKMYSFDLAGHGTIQFPEPETYLLAGFSDKTMDILGALEADRDALINKITSIEL